MAEEKSSKELKKKFEGTGTYLSDCKMRKGKKGVVFLKCKKSFRAEKVSTKDEK